MIPIYMVAFVRTVPQTCAKVSKLNLWRNEWSVKQGKLLHTAYCYFTRWLAVLSKHRDVFALYTHPAYPTTTLCCHCFWCILLYVEYYLKYITSSAWTNVALSSHGSSCEEDGGTNNANPCTDAIDGKLISSSVWASANPGIGAWIKVSRG